jgi:hypothetical protein
LKQKVAENTQRQVTHRTVIGGHLDVVQGYLVYKFFTGECRKPNRTHYPNRCRKR